MAVACVSDGPATTARVTSRPEQHGPPALRLHVPIQYIYIYTYMHIHIYIYIYTEALKRCL